MKSERKPQHVLLTGAAGFIGSHVAGRLLERGDRVMGLDNLSDYYDPALKQARLQRLEGGEFSSCTARSGRPHGNGRVVRCRAF